MRSASNSRVSFSVGCQAMPSARLSGRVMVVDTVEVARMRELKEVKSAERPMAAAPACEVARKLASPFTFRVTSLR